jgi:hypothetical protein
MKVGQVKAEVKVTERVIPNAVRDLLDCSCD